ncbi:MAG: 2-dehydro-3-deoxyphosphogluconate aldolase, partial [Acidobacteria bacterium]|nr:2-dehydro-3-deoxyphosphogluconate aldolase [Acidobacteriota bacterium]
MPWSREKALGLIREVGLIPIIRASTSEDAFQAVEAIVAGGVPIAEVTMVVPNALRVMERAVEHFGDEVLLGAGTVLDTETCRAAIFAGAGLIQPAGANPGGYTLTVAGLSMPAGIAVGLGLLWI